MIRTDDLLAAIRREHTCPDCTGRNESAGTEAVNDLDVGRLPAEGPASYSHAAPDPTEPS